MRFARRVNGVFLVNSSTKLPVKLLFLELFPLLLDPARATRPSISVDRPCKGPPGAKSHHLKRPCRWGAATLESIFLTVAAVGNHCQENCHAHSFSWRRSQVVRQRSAKPSSPVRIRAAPLQVRTRLEATENDKSPSAVGFPDSSTSERSIPSSHTDATENDAERPPVTTL
jgi:hypothetical protein